MHNPTTEEAYKIQQQLQEAMVKAGYTPAQANAAGPNLFVLASEERITIGDTTMTLRDWITSFIKGTFPTALQIPINMVRHIFEITFKLGGSALWLAKSLEVGLKTMAEHHAGPMVGLIQVIHESTAAGGVLNFMSDLTMGQCFTISTLLIGMKYGVMPYGKNVLNFILGETIADKLLNIPQDIRNSLFGAVDSVVETMAVTFLSDAALHSLVLPGPEGVMGEDLAWREWGETSKNFLRDTGKFSATGLLSSSSSSSSSTTNFDEGQAVFQLIDICMGGAAMAASVPFMLGAAGAREVVIGCRRLYREISGIRVELFSGSSASSVSSASVQSRQTEISVYKFIDEMPSVLASTEDSLRALGRSTAAEVIISISKKELLPRNQPIFVAGGANLVAGQILGHLIPSSCSSSIKRQPSSDLKRSYSVMSGISELSLSTDDTCTSNVDVIVARTLKDAIKQIESPVRTAEEEEEEGQEMDEGGRRRRTRKHRKSTKGRKTRKYHRVRKTRRSRKSRKGRKSRKY